MERTVQDALGRTVTYTYPPKRIVSLCPGITDTLFALELQDEVIGRTRFCIHPSPAVLDVKAVAGTKDIKLDAILQLKPDLIIAEKEENTRDIVEALEQHLPVYVAEVQNVQEAYTMIENIGDVTDRRDQAQSLVSEIQEGFQSLHGLTSGSAMYVIWKKPYMAAGRTTYIDSLLETLGFSNPVREFSGRYPELTTHDFQSANPDLVLLASEPYPFKEKHIPEFQEILPNASILPIDGEMFWYGPRMLEATSYFRDRLN
ncbi:iron ABC transporter substrate-binding protein [Sporosarcina sp. BI001-red]|uniref:ABC transporter substrate-binding protein n=1 Tax=Sporosarcina sp. BI001-red TaxID=2282866 RepID=UPI000E277287|nr:helical backbone metal receptor [Sporosarcina sp. BI001-red]REB04706.1 iron ABC transporter substrate-binding protein [Sporosarcina sp. BI001-red]